MFLGGMISGYAQQSPWEVLRSCILVGMADAVQTRGRFVVPEVLVTHFHVRPGDRVADFGAGRGTFAEILSRSVGPSGRVYACDIQRSLVESVSEMVRSRALTNIEPLWCDIEAIGGTKIEDEAIDTVIIINTLFQVDDKGNTLEEAKRILRTGGKLFVVDWSDSFGGLGPVPAQVLSEQDARAYAETHGYIFEHSFDAGDHHYGLAFRKP